jgi:TRAP-type C4-dicarboxylate transport system permease small subunit
MASRLPSRALHILDRLVAGAIRAAVFLVLPVSLLLFLQWPLREIVRAYSREANDLAQILFALYVSVAVTAATRERSHLAADAIARRFSPRWRDRLQRLACLAILIPTSLFVLYDAAPAAWQSLLQLERFPETLNPGYFLVRLAVLLLAALVLAQAILDLFARRDSPPP